MSCIKTQALLCSNRIVISDDILVGSGRRIDATRYQNHVIDPTFFFDAIEEFSFNYQICHMIKKYVDDEGYERREYQSEVIRGSLQSHGNALNESRAGSTTDMKYSFYCTSLYRINIGDVILYKHNCLMVDSIHDYDEFGCRSCSLTMIQLQAYRDLAEYVNYLEGREFI